MSPGHRAGARPPLAIVFASSASSCIASSVVSNLQAITCVRRCCNSLSCARALMLFCSNNCSLL